MNMSDEPGNQGGMDARVTRLEKHVEAIMIDVSVLKTDVSVLKTDVSVLKTDVAALKLDVGLLKNTSATKADVAEAKAAIIMWVTAAVFLSQLIPEIISFSRSLY